MEILQSIIGSTMHALNTPTSDIDTRTIVVSPLREMLDPFTDRKIRSHQTDGDDNVVYELQSFLKLLAKGSPSVIDIVYSPYATATSQIGREFFINRNKFIDKTAAVRALSGYADTMLSNAEKGVRPFKSLRSVVLTAEVVYTCLVDGNYNPLTSDTRHAILDIQGKERELDRLLQELLVPLVLRVEATEYTNHFDLEYVKDFCLAAYQREDKLIDNDR